MIKKTYGWIKDYIHLTHAQTHSFLIKEPPKHYLGHVIEGKSSIILIPGYLEKWNFLRKIADPLSHDGHPIYVVQGLEYNTKEIKASAKVIRELLNKKNLKHVILISHSKGGLIGKYLLAFENEDKTIEKLITVATPWSGSHIAKFIPHKSADEFYPSHETIKKLQEQEHINNKIVSIYGVFDNHVWPTKSCHLEGAKNIEVNTHGHHTILFNKEVIEIIQEEVVNEL